MTTRGSRPALTFGLALPEDQHGAGHLQQRTALGGGPVLLQPDHAAPSGRECLHRHAPHQPRAAAGGAAPVRARAPQGARLP
eukprot:7669383-Pyramimonas_sp.AAC.1